MEVSNVELADSDSRRFTVPGAAGFAVVHQEALADHGVGSNQPAELPVSRSPPFLGVSVAGKRWQECYLSRTRPRPLRVQLRLVYHGS
jgi:hypothetical protein